MRRHVRAHFPGFPRGKALLFYANLCLKMGWSESRFANPSPSTHPPPFSSLDVNGLSWGGQCKHVQPFCEGFTRPQVLLLRQGGILGMGMALDQWVQ